MSYNVDFENGFKITPKIRKEDIHKLVKESRQVIPTFCSVKWGNEWHLDFINSMLRAQSCSHYYWGASLRAAIDSLAKYGYNVNGESRYKGEGFEAGIITIRDNDVKIREFN